LEAKGFYSQGQSTQYQKPEATNKKRNKLKKSDFLEVLSFYLAKLRDLDGDLGVYFIAVESFDDFEDLRVRRVVFGAF
jgi:hypothetical protein